MNNEVQKQKNGAKRMDTDLLQHHGAACRFQGCFQFLCFFFGNIGPDFLRERLY